MLGKCILINTSIAHNPFQALVDLYSPMDYLIGVEPSAWFVVLLRCSSKLKRFSSPGTRKTKGPPDGEPDLIDRRPEDNSAPPCASPFGPSLRDVRQRSCAARRT